LDKTPTNTDSKLIPVAQVLKLVFNCCTISTFCNTRGSTELIPASKVYVLPAAAVQICEILNNQTEMYEITKSKRPTVSFTTARGERVDS